MPFPRTSVSQSEIGQRLTSAADEGQAAIAGYKKNGEQLFFPNA